VLSAALDAHAPVEALYYSPDAALSGAAAALVERARVSGVRVFALQRGVLERVADAVTPQPVVGVVGDVHRPLGAVLESAAPGEPVVVCVDVRDPGNLGAIVRAADAAGAAGVVCCDTSADLYNPKCVRASAGSLFHVPVVLDLPAPDVLDALGRAGYVRAATVVRGGVDYATAPLGDRVAVVLGNEAHGLDATIASSLDAWLSIPMYGGAESLNVAMAATVVCFELARRRRHATGATSRGALGEPVPARPVR